MTRLPILNDSRQQNAHSLFQVWRQLHPSGLFLNVNGRQTMLHSSSCPHFEGTELDREQWGGSLTKRQKVLGGTVANLSEWASEHGLVALKCSNCNDLSARDAKTGTRGQKSAGSDLKQAS